MVRKQDGLVPIGEALADLSGPVQALKRATLAQRGFTQADQVHQLVSASEAGPDRGFMARMMALCSRPRTNPRDRLRYVRRNGPYTLVMSATTLDKLPFGANPRLILAWICTEAVRTGSRDIVLGRSLAEFMRTLGIYHNSGGRGGVQTRLRNQMDRLFNASVQLIYEDEHGEQFISSAIADRGAFWWNERKPDQPSLWESKIYLGEAFFHEIIRHPVPIDMNTPHGPQTLRPGPRSVPVADLPDIQLEAPAAAHLAAPVPPVRSAPRQSQRQKNRSKLSRQDPARVEEDQAGLAEVELRDGQGRADPLAIGAFHSAFSPGGIAPNKALPANQEDR